MRRQALGRLLACWFGFISPSHCLTFTVLFFLSLFPPFLAEVRKSGLVVQWLLRHEKAATMLCILKSLGTRTMTRSVQTLLRPAVSRAA